MTLHTTLHFLACRDCGMLLPIHGPDFMLSNEQDTDDPYRTFLAAHRNHHTVCLWRNHVEVRANRPLWDPMATLMFEVTDGELSYVVRASRQSIEDERAYRFEPGMLDVGNAEVHLDPHDLRRGLDLQFYPHALRPTKIDQFLSAVHELLNRIDPDQLVIAFDAADDPDVSIACMPDGVYDEIQARCGEIFDPWELPRVLDFLRDNRDANGLLALRVRRQVTALSA